VRGGEGVEEAEPLMALVVGVENGCSEGGRVEGCNYNACFFLRIIR
jgi:hypothetical protein